MYRLKIVTRGGESVSPVIDTRKEASLRLLQAIKKLEREPIKDCVEVYLERQVEGNWELYSSYIHEEVQDIPDWVKKSLNL